MDSDYTTACATVVGLRQAVDAQIDVTCSMFGVPRSVGERQARDIIAAPTQAGYSDLLNLLAYFLDLRSQGQWLLPDNSTVASTRALPDDDPSLALLMPALHGEVEATLRQSVKAQNIALRAQWGPLAHADAPTRLRRAAWLAGCLADGYLVRQSPDAETRDLRRSIHRRASLYAALTGKGRSGVLECNKYLAAQRGPVGAETPDGLRDRMELLERMYTTPAVITAQEGTQ